MLKRVFAIVLAFVLMLATASCALAARSSSEIIQEMILDYGFYQDEATPYVDKLLDELTQKDKEQGALWRRIMDYWKYTTNDLEIRYAKLPKNMENTDQLCLIVLGFHLMPDGSMRPELEGRLETALNCAMQYPDCYVLCTGGGTATKNSKAREANQMAKWLVEHGLEESRIIVENESKTTGENAIKSYAILREKYPQIRYAAIITSDYHIPWGYILFQSEFWIGAAQNGGEAIEVVTHAACKWTPEKDYPFNYQAGGLMELIGQKKRANKIYERHQSAPKLK